MKPHKTVFGSMCWVLGLLLTALGGRAAESASVPNVAIVRTAAWSQGDPAREGAAEFVILMEVARLRREPAQGGLVAVGDRRGLFNPGAEEVLRHAVLQGVPVVKLASGGRVLPAPHGLFLDGGNLPEDEACQVLRRCLARYGALPSAADRASPSLRARLQQYQQEFNLAAGTRIALR
jgi:hypothetical protein